MDFSKFKIPTHEEHCFYRCDRCGEEGWYVLRLPDHMLTHTRMGGVGRRCGGALVLVESKMVALRKGEL